LQAASQTPLVGLHSDAQKAANEMACDVIVIGAAIGGLTAALSLQRHGCSGNLARASW
jgi:heterodisulfide reductase subunit A-like polyferredoxin